MLKRLQAATFSIPLYKLVISFALLISVLIFFYWLNTSFNTTAMLTQDTIELFILQTGVYAWLVFVVVVALFVILPFPSSTLGIVGGYIFNPYLAIVLMLAGEFIGACLNFVIGKKVVGYYFKHGRFPKVEAAVLRQTKRLTPLGIFVLAIVPASTTNMTAYAAGLSGMRFTRYVVPWISGIGLLSVCTIFLGHSALLNAPLVSVGIIAIIVVLFLTVSRFARA